MNTEVATTTIKAGLADESTLIEQSPSTSAQDVVVFVGSHESGRSDKGQPLPRSTASVLKAFAGCTRIRSSFAAVKSEEFFLPESGKLGWQDEDELDLPEVPQWLEARRKRNAAAIALLDKWLSDDSGYDEATWPDLKEAIELSRTSTRRRFSD